MIDVTQKSMPYVNSEGIDRNIPKTILPKKKKKHSKDHIQYIQAGIMYGFFCSKIYVRFYLKVVFICLLVNKQDISDMIK